MRITVAFGRYGWMFQAGYQRRPTPDRWNRPYYRHLFLGLTIFRYREWCLYLGRPTKFLSIPR